MDVVALDCEMVGVGPKGSKSRLGRVSIVDYDGRVLLDMFSKPDEPVTDYRTRWSGLRKADIINANPFDVTIRMVENILRDKIVVGHSIQNDLDVLGHISIPADRIRDTQKYNRLQNISTVKGGRGSKLKVYARHILGRVIQRGEHCSVEDARATMDLYKHVEEDWERDIAENSENIAQHAEQEENNNILFTPMGFLAFLFLVALVTRNVTLFVIVAAAVYVFLNYSR